MNGQDHIPHPEVPALIGMVHLLPLPGSPSYGGSRRAVIDRALADALVLADAGFDALLIENYGDVPFHKDECSPSVVSEMTCVALEIRRAVQVPVGVQVLRNDALSALAIAGAVDASFIRVNVLTGVMVTDQGLIEGNAADVMRFKRSHDIHAAVYADVLVKHAVPLGPVNMAQAVRDAVTRGLADAVIVSGAATGSPADMIDVMAAKGTCAAPVLVGSGVTSETVRSLLSIADGVIAGTALKTGGLTVNPVDPEKAREFIRAARG
jgi:membrane complex biogenesis BtpA family protein